VDIILRVLWKIVINDVRDTLYVYAPASDISGYKHFGFA
jgi:hypothetical protein